MDLWRILLIGAVVVGLVLVLLPAPEEIPGSVGGEIVEQGTYVVERTGLSPLEETFTLWMVGDLYRVESTLRVGAREVKAILVLDRWWNPLYYVETGQAPVSVRIVEGRPRVTSGSGLFRRESTVDAFPPYAFLGVEAVGPWFAVHRYLHAQPRAGSVTAVLPGKRTTVSLVGSAPESVGLVSGGRTLPAEVYRVRLGDEDVWLYGQGDLLVGGKLFGEGWTFYLREVLPDGLQTAP